MFRFFQHFFVFIFSVKLNNKSTYIVERNSEVATDGNQNMTMSTNSGLTSFENVFLFN